uniref:Proliferating cell nuclear antigen n=1 Tax=Panagrolaimus sp. ES5 TaxID=591445 RepID=A0AC34FU18_9BILA
MASTMLLKAKLEKPSVFKKIIDLVKDVVTDDAPFTCSKNDLSLLAMDASKAALISLRLSKKFFTLYNCDGDVFFGLSLESVSKALKFANDEDSSYMEFHESEQSIVTFTIRDSSKTKKIKIKVSPIQEHIGIPYQKYAATIEMASAEFAKTCQELSEYSSEFITISSNKNGLTFSAEDASSKIIDLVKDVVTDDAPFNCSKHDIILLAMDSSKAALISLRFSKKFFTLFNCDGDVFFGISLESVLKALKFANDDDSCCMEFHESEQSIVIFTIRDSEQTKTKKIKIKVSPMQEHIGIPYQKYAATIEMASAEFAKTCQELSEYSSDFISISSNKNGITFSAEDASSVSCSITYKNESDAAENEDFTTSFSIQYLLLFSKATEISDRVRLSLAINVPLLVEYEINEDAGYLRYYLAPLMPEDADIAKT